MVRMFLVTANVGSVFEDIEHGLSLWLNEFISVIRSKEPEFVAVHFQETGGKNYVNGSNVIDIFFGQLLERMGQLNFRRAEGFVDSRIDLEEQFTALSNVYFVHESVQPHAVAIWDFQDNCFKDVPSPAKLHVGSGLDVASTKQKEKFPQSFFPNCRWSRKGFLRTRWRINGKILDLVNIHLFHDSDNLIAASSFPSVFAQCRERGLKYTLKTLQNGPLDKSPLFVFGDFNFRIDSHGVISVLTQELGEPKDDFGPFAFGSKTFVVPDQELRFLHSFDWLKKYDFELKSHAGALAEFDLNFHPTYPFEEDILEPEKYMRTRPPSWCDRVVFTPQTKDIISEETPVEYSVMGSKTCMGDHKPVYLSFSVSPSSHSLNDLPHPEEQSSTGKVRSFSKSGSSTSSMNMGPPKKCKCLVSLIKCNLTFPKGRLLSRSASESESVISNSHSNSGAKQADESQKVSRHFSPKKAIWKCKRNNSDIEDDEKTTTSGLIEVDEPLITDKPSNNKSLSEGDNLLLPFPAPAEMESINNSKNKDSTNMILSVGVPLKIQDLNVISSHSDKSSGKNLESSKLPFSWTKKRRSSYPEKSSLGKSKSKSTKSCSSSTLESDSLLCSKCVIL